MHTNQSLTLPSPPATETCFCNGCSLGSAFFHGTYLHMPASHSLLWYMYDQNTNSDTQSPTRCPKSSRVWVCKVLIHPSPDTCNSCHPTLSDSDLCLLSAPHFLVPGNLAVSLYSGWTCNVCLCPLTPCIYTDSPGPLQSIFQLNIFVWQLGSLGSSHILWLDIRCVLMPFDPMHFLGLYKVYFS